MMYETKEKVEQCTGPKRGESGMSSNFQNKVIFVCLVIDTLQTLPIKKKQ